MSAEEKAVRDALAAVQADTGISKASDLISGKTSTTTATTKSTDGEVKTYEEAKAVLATLGDLSKFPTLNSLVGGINSLVSQEKRTNTLLSTLASNAGVTVNPNTGTVVLLTVKSSEYVGTGKDRQRIDTMSDGSKRTFADPDLNFIPTPVGTKDVDVLKATLKGRGIPASLVDSSATFLTSLKSEGLDNDSIVEIYLNNKDYITKNGTTLTSPFYSTYGFYNEKLTDKYSAAELFQTVEGYKASAAKYNLDSKFTSTQNIQNYLSNKVSVAKFDDNANKARLFAVTADPDRVKTLQDLGYINTAQDLTDFYMDSTIGTEKMQQNINTAALAIEAVKRSNAATGIKLDTEAIKKYGAELTAKGMSESQISALASQGYQNIAASLAPTTKLSGIYEGGSAANTSTIQSELEQEQFRGIESQRRRKLAEQEVMAFQGRSGTTAQSLRKGTISGSF